MKVLKNTGFLYCDIFTLEENWYVESKQKLSVVLCENGVDQMVQVTMIK